MMHQCPDTANWNSKDVPSCNKGATKAETGSCIVGCGAFHWAEYHHKKVGNLTDITVYSFHALKPHHRPKEERYAESAGTFNHEDIYRDLNAQMLHGQPRMPWRKPRLVGGDMNHRTGVKYNMTECRPPSVWSNLPVWYRHAGTTQTDFRQICDAFSNYAWAQVPEYKSDDATLSYHVFLLRIRDINTKCSVMRSSREFSTVVVSWVTEQMNIDGTPVENSLDISSRCTSVMSLIRSKNTWYEEVASSDLIFPEPAPSIVWKASAYLSKNLFASYQHVCIIPGKFDQTDGGLNIVILYLYPGRWCHIATPNWGFRQGILGCPLKRFGFTITYSLHVKWSGDSAIPSPSAVVILTAWKE